MGVLDELIYLILSENSRFSSLLLCDLSLCNLSSLIVLASNMGRITLILPQEVSLRTRCNNVSESPLKSVKCYLNEWKEAFL